MSSTVACSERSACWAAAGLGGRTRDNTFQNSRRLSRSPSRARRTETPRLRLLHPSPHQYFAQNMLCNHTRRRVTTKQASSWVLGSRSPGLATALSMTHPEHPSRQSRALRALRVDELTMSHHTRSARGRHKRSLRQSASSGRCPPAAWRIARHGRTHLRRRRPSAVDQALSGQMSIICLQAQRPRCTCARSRRQP